MMMRQAFSSLTCLSIIGLAVAASAAPLNELALHYAVRTDKAPVIDGNLDDECWSNAPKFTRYRHMYGPKEQKTSVQELWDKNGLYIGVTNYESDLDKLKAAVRTRDGGQIWADDSAEIYIDPTASGYSDYQFCINSIGTLGDYWQVDMGFTDWSWSASSAQVACKKNSDSWNIEFFVSWSDMKKTPETGDVWMIFHRRLAYTSSNGSLSDSSTSGGNYMNRCFGYLFFVGKEIPSTDEMIKKIGSLAKAPWVLALEDGKCIFAETGKAAAVEKTPEIVAKLKGEAESSLKSVGEASKNSETQKDVIKELHARYEAADKTTDEFKRMAEYMSIRDTSANILDELALSEIIKQ